MCGRQGAGAQLSLSRWPSCQVSRDSALRPSSERKPQYFQACKSSLYTGLRDVLAIACYVAHAGTGSKQSSRGR